MKINGIEYNWKAVDSDGAISYHVEKPTAKPVSDSLPYDFTWHSESEFLDGSFEEGSGLSNDKSLKFIGSGRVKAEDVGDKILNIIEKLALMVSSKSGCSNCSNAADHYEHQVKIGEILSEIRGIRSK